MDQISAVDTKNKAIAESLMAKSYLTISELQQSEIWEQVLPFFTSEITNARQLLYHYLVAMQSIPACKCGSPLGWDPDKRQYRIFCSKKCTAQFSVAAKKQQHLIKHGVEWHTQLPDWHTKVRQTSLLKFGVEHYSKTTEFHSVLTELHANNRRIKLTTTIKEPACIIEPSKGISAQERKLYEYFIAKGIVVQLKNRTIIAPKEIDLYFPDAKFGVEINGGYWHSEQFQPDANAQLNKITLAAAAGVELWHFWDWEINDNWGIVISKIEHRLGLSRKVHARKLTIKEVAKREAASFLVDNHLQGACQSKIALGLYDSDNVLLMVATFGASRFTAKYRWELLRMAAAKGVGVVGGAARLLAHFKKVRMKSSETLVSYCQRRFSQGNVYSQIGFVLQHATGPGYQYVKSGLPAGSRNCWQKHMMAAKLPNFDPALTGDCNMRNAGYYRAWDCGQWVFTVSI